MKRLFCWCAAVGCAWLSACVSPQQVDVIEREQRRLRSETTNTVLEGAAVRKELDSARANLADTRANLQQLQRDLNALKEKVEEVRYQLDRRLGQSSKEGDLKVKDLEGRLSKIDEDLKALRTRQEEMRPIQEASKAQPAQGAPAAEGTEGTSDFAREKVSGESEAARKDYDEAWKFLEQKDYKRAIDRFKAFLKKHPKSAYADNAQYWIGECHYALKEFDQAILEFDAVRRNYPKGDKVPAALLKQGFAFAELGDKVDARLILQELINRYPQSSEASRAKQKLKSLES
jgi:tol-pal system protein YbgF